MRELRRADLLWAVAVLLLAWSAVGQAGRAGRTDAALELRDSLVAAHARTADSLMAVIDDQRRATAAALTAADVRARRHAARADAAETSAAGLAGRIRPGLPDSLRAMFDSLREAHGTAIAAKDRVMAERDGQVALLVADTVTTNAALGAMHTTMHEALKQAEAWKRKARGPLVRVVWGPGVGVVVDPAGVPHLGPGFFIGLQVRH